MSDMSRKEAIEYLINWDKALESQGDSPYSDARRALAYGIHSLETDEAYQLEYEKPFDKLVADYCKEHGQVIVDKDVWDDVKEYVKPEFCEDAVSRKEAQKVFFDKY